MEFSEILKELRVEKSLKRKQVAEGIGYSLSIIGFWENGKKQPTAAALKALAKFFNVSADYLLGLEDAGGAKLNAKEKYNAAGSGNADNSDTKKLNEMQKILNELLQK